MRDGRELVRGLALAPVLPFPVGRLEHVEVEARDAFACGLVAALTTEEVAGGAAQVFAETANGLGLGGVEAAVGGTPAEHGEDEYQRGHAGDGEEDRAARQRVTGSTSSERVPVDLVPCLFGFGRNRHFDLRGLGTAVDPQQPEDELEEGREHIGDRNEERVGQEPGDTPGGSGHRRREQVDEGLEEDADEHHAEDGEGGSAHEQRGGHAPRAQAAHAGAALRKLRAGQGRERHSVEDDTAAGDDSGLARLGP